MDSTGVPHKINRHVYKAVNQLGKDACNFSNIYNYVKVCTRNLKPVPHLKETIQKSLNNLKASGVVKVDARKKIYKLKPKLPILKDNQNNKFGESSSNENLSPQTRKHKRQQSDTDDDEYDDLESVPKRFKASTKLISKTRLQVKKLPKHRKYNIRNERSQNSVKERHSVNRSKASVIYKKTNNVTSGVNINHKPVSDKNLNNNNNNNECEKRKSKEPIYDLRVEKDEKTKDNDNENKDTESIISKPVASHHSIDFEDVQNEPGEQVPDLNDTNNNNQQDVEGSPLGNIRRYNFNYLN